LKEKDYNITIKGTMGIGVVCQILDDILGLITQVAMTIHQMFPLYLSHST